jgi:hypothetical protein
LNKLKITRLLIAYYRIVFLVYYFTAAQNSDPKQTLGWNGKKTAHQIGTPLSSLIGLKS